MCDVLIQYSSLCVLADGYSLAIKLRGLHFQSCYFVKGCMNSLDLCQFRYCLPPVSVRSSQLFPLRCTSLFRWPFWSQEKCRWKALGSSRGPACQIEERNWWLAMGKPGGPECNELFVPTSRFAQPITVDVNCLTLSLSGFLMLLFLHILNLGHWLSISRALPCGKWCVTWTPASLEEDPPRCPQKSYFDSKSLRVMSNFWDSMSRASSIIPTG